MPAVGRCNRLLHFCRTCLVLLVLPFGVVRAGTRDDRPTQLGVGFSLTLDYGTSAIYFPNGTSVAIAKIQGSPDYQRFMRLENAAGAPPAEEKLHHNPLARLLSATDVCAALPTFLQRALCPAKSPDSIAAEAMFHALRVSTASYLGIPVHVCDVAVAYLLSDYQRGVLNSASSALGLGHALSAQVLAGHVAAIANGIGECRDTSCDYDNMKPQLVLTVDYNRAALSMVLYSEDAGVFEYERIRHRADLGAGALTRPSNDGANHWKRVEQEVREIVKMPVTKAGHYVLESINQLVLLGDQALDPHLLKILLDVLGENVAPKAQPDGMSGGDIVDPVFAAAIGVAKASWKRLNEDAVPRNEPAREL